MCVVVAQRHVVHLHSVMHGATLSQSLGLSGCQQAPTYAQGISATDQGSEGTSHTFSSTGLTKLR